MNITKKWLLTIGGLSAIAAGTALVVACGTTESQATTNPTAGNPTTEDRSLTNPTSLTEAEAQQAIVNPGNDALLKTINAVVARETKLAPIEAVKSAPKTYNKFNVMGISLEVNGVLAGTLIDVLKQVWGIEAAKPLIDFLAPLESAGISLTGLSDMIVKLDTNYDGQNGNVTNSWRDFLIFWRGATNVNNEHAYLKDTLIKRGLFTEAQLRILDSALAKLGNNKPIYKGTNPTTPPVTTKPEEPKTTEPTTPPVTTNPTTPVVIKTLPLTFEALTEEAAKAQLTNPGDNAFLQLLSRAVSRETRLAIVEALKKLPSAYDTFTIAPLPPQPVNGVLVGTLIDVLRNVWGISQDVPLTSFIGPLTSAGLNIVDLGSLVTKLDTNYDSKNNNVTNSWRDYVSFWKNLAEPTNNYANLKISLINRGIFTEASLRILDQELAKIGNKTPIFKAGETVTWEAPKAEEPKPTEPTKPQEPTNPTTPTTPEEPKTTEPTAPVTPGQPIIKLSEAEAIAKITTPNGDALFTILNRVVGAQSAKAIVEALKKLPETYNSFSILGQSLPDVNGMVAGMFIEMLLKVWGLPANTSLFSLLPALQAGGMQLDGLPTLITSLPQDYEGTNDATQSWADFAYFWALVSDPTNDYAYLKNTLINKKVFTLAQLREFDKALRSPDIGAKNTIFSDTPITPVDPTRPTTPPQPEEPTKLPDNYQNEASTLLSRGKVTRHSEADAKKIIMNPPANDPLLQSLKWTLEDFAKSKNMSLAQLLETNPGSHEQRVVIIDLKVLTPLMLKVLLEQVWEVKGGIPNPESTLQALFTDLLNKQLLDIPKILESVVWHYDGTEANALDDWSSVLHFTELGGNPDNEFAVLKSILVRNNVLTESDLRKLDAILSVPTTTLTNVPKRNGGGFYYGLGGKHSIYAKVKEAPITEQVLSENDAINKIQQYAGSGLIYEMIFLSVFDIDRYDNDFTFYDIEYPVWATWSKPVVDWFVNDFLGFFGNSGRQYKRTPVNTKPKWYTVDRLSSASNRNVSVNRIFQKMLPRIFQFIYGLDANATRLVTEAFDDADSGASNYFRDLFGMGKNDFINRFTLAATSMSYNALDSWSNLVRFTSWLLTNNTAENKADYLSNYRMIMKQILGTNTFKDVDQVFGAAKLAPTSVVRNGEIVLGLGSDKGVAENGNAATTKNLWQSAEGQAILLKRYLPLVWGINPHDITSEPQLKRFSNAIDALSLNSKLSELALHINLDNYDGKGTSALTSEAAFYQFLYAIAGYDGVARYQANDTFDSYLLARRALSFTGNALGTKEQYEKANFDAPWLAFGVRRDATLTLAHSLLLKLFGKNNLNSLNDIVASKAGELVSVINTYTHAVKQVPGVGARASLLSWWSVSNPTIHPEAATPEARTTSLLDHSFPNYLTSREALQLIASTGNNVDFINILRKLASYLLSSNASLSALRTANNFDTAVTSAETIGSGIEMIASTPLDTNEIMRVVLNLILRESYGLYWSNINELLPTAAKVAGLSVTNIYDNFVNYSGANFGSWGSLLKHLNTVFATGQGNLRNLLSFIFGSQANAEAVNALFSASYDLPVVFNGKNLGKGLGGRKVPPFAVGNAFRAANDLFPSA